MVTQSRDFGQMAREMRASLDKYSKEELADLLTHLVRVYVVEGGASVSLDAGVSADWQQLRALSFSQLVLHLQMNLPHEELRGLHVSGARVWVEQGGVEISLTPGEESAEQPPDADVIEPTQEPVPAQRAGSPGVAIAVEPPATGPVYPDRWDEPPVPVRGAPRPRSSEHTGSPGTTIEEVGRVQRPEVRLRNQPPSPPSRLPPPTAGPGPSRRGETLPPPREERSDERFSMPAIEEVREKFPPDQDPAEEVGEVSDRFSMLELD